MEEKGPSQQERINKTIPIQKEAFSSSKGIFVDVYKGNLTDIVKRFNSRGHDDPSTMTVEQSQNEIMQLLLERDNNGRTPLDLAW